MLGGVQDGAAVGSALMQRHRAAELELKRWQDRKAQRVQEQGALQVQSFSPVSPSASSIYYCLATMHRCGAGGGQCAEGARGAARHA